MENSNNFLLLFTKMINNRYILGWIKEANYFTFDNPEFSIGIEGEKIPTYKLIVTYNLVVHAGLYMQQYNEETKVSDFVVVSESSDENPDIVFAWFESIITIVFKGIYDVVTKQQNVRILKKKRNNKINDDLEDAMRYLATNTGVNYADSMQNLSKAMNDVKFNMDSFAKFMEKELNVN